MILLFKDPDPQHWILLNIFMILINIVKRGVQAEQAASLRPLQTDGPRNPRMRGNSDIHEIGGFLAFIFGAFVIPFAEFTNTIKKVYRTYFVIWITWIHICFLCPVSSDFFFFSTIY